MKSDTQLMNELAQRTNFLHELTEKESEALKKVLMEIYIAVAEVCKKHHLTIMLCAGSCLGAIRHKGFIPWDDDLDVLMPRKDYDRLIELLKEGMLSDKYEFDAPDKHKDAKHVFLKIYKKNTINEDIFSEGNPFPKGICIDIFSLDAVPETKFGQFIKGFIANALMFISILVLYAQYPNPKLKAFVSLDKILSRRYKFKCFLGKIFGIIPHYKWVWWYDCFVASTNESKYLGIPVGNNYYTGEILPYDVYLPVAKAIFEGVEVNIPHDYDTYLRRSYKDYMQLPPVEKRERHFTVKFQLNCK